MYLACAFMASGYGPDDVVPRLLNLLKIAHSKMGVSKLPRVKRMELGGDSVWRMGEIFRSSWK